MKKILLTVSLCCFSLALAPLAHASVQLGDYNAGMIGYWSLNDNFGATARDTSGGGHDAVLTSPIWTTGQFNYALQFAGSPQIASTSLQWPSNGGSMTLWVYPTSYADWISPAGWKKDPAVSTNGYILLDEGGSGTPGRWRAVFKPNVGGNAEISVSAVASISQNTWQQLTMTWSLSGSTYTIHLYVNGVDQGATTWTGTPGSTGVGSFHFGNSGDYPDNYFLGSVDDVRVYNYAMSASQAKAAYQSGTQSFTIGKSSTNILTSGLVGYWPMDGRYTNWASNVLSDVSGQNNSCRLISMPTSTSPVAGKIGQALLFNSTSSWCQSSIGSEPTLNITGDLTVSAWMYSTSGVANQDIMRAGQGTDDLYTLFYDGLNKRIQFSWYNGTSFVIINSNSNVVPLSQWTHVVVTRSGSVLNFYVNGIFVGTGTFTSAPVSPITFTIGGTTTGSQPFKGNLDDVRLYNRALSAQEVQQLYKNSGGTIAQSNATLLNSGLTGYWTFDGKNTNWATGVAVDSSGNSNNGTLINIATSTFGTTSGPVAGKVGQALKFNGSSSQITGFTASTSAANSNRTLCAWINTTSISRQGIMSDRPTTNGWALTINRTSAGNITYINNAVVIEAAGGITANKWYDVCASFQASNLAVRLYVNGSQVGSGTIASTDSDSGNNGIIGYDGSGFFQGAIDDVHVYNRVLSSQEIYHLYASTK